jgi:hypothetical protein
MTIDKATRTRLYVPIITISGDIRAVSVRNRGCYGGARK